MFVHAINGCDTIPAPYTKSKKRALEALRSYCDQDALSHFTEPPSAPEDMANVGEICMEPNRWTNFVTSCRA